MDQEQMDGSFRGNTHLNIWADLYLGKNLATHLKKVLSEIESINYIIEQDGYMHPDIKDSLEMKRYLKRLESHLRKAIIDPNHRPDYEHTIHTDCDD